MDIFKLVQAPIAEDFYQRSDPNDIRLGERAQYDPAAYSASRVVLIGLPQDEGVRRNKGREGAAAAPAEIRRCLYKTVMIPGLRFFDLGNTILADSLEETHARHQRIIEALLNDGKTVIVLGGGNDTSYPDCAALSHHSEGDIMAFNVDTHFDVRANSPRNSGTPYRQLLDEGLIQPRHFYEIANQPFANSPDYQLYLDTIGVKRFSRSDVERQGMAKLLHNILATDSTGTIFWGLDMDVVRAADAPGVSAPSPTGISADDFCMVAQVAGAEARSRIFEITEVNPRFDIDQRTCRLAAVAIWHFLYHFHHR